MRLVIFTLLAVALPALAGAEPCECTSWDDEPGVLWTGCSPLVISQVAALAAPALWFTRDEPLLLAEDFKRFPQNHPCDTPSDEAIVYYQVTELVREGEPLTRDQQEDPAPFARINNMILKYFFYYPEDFGLGGHLHDLEAVELEIFLEESEGCYRVRHEGVRPSGSHRQDLHRPAAGA